jgi:hypothetical protein
MVCHKKTSHYSENALTFRFDSYPLDSHFCTLRFYSGYDTKSILFTPTKFVYRKDKKSIVLEFDTDVKQLEVENLQFTERNMPKSNISTTGLQFALSRYGCQGRDSYCKQVGNYFNLAHQSGSSNFRLSQKSSMCS